MKEVKKYNGEMIQAYQPEDLAKLSSVFAAAKALWVQQWIEQGAVDEGSCCGGKGISVPFIGKGKRHWAKGSNLIFPICRKFPYTPWADTGKRLFHAIHRRNSPVADNTFNRQQPLMCV